METSHATIDRILEKSRGSIGRDYEAYRNHVYRVAHFTRALLGRDRIDDQVAVAASFHDIGIWTDGTLDYLDPSARRAREWIAAEGAALDADEISRMIVCHHKIRSCDDANVEAFREADLVDLAFGAVRFGLDAGFVREVRDAFPNAGFHLCLLRQAVRWLPKHPLRPFPMYRW